MTTEVLEYTDVFQESLGALHEGRLRLTNNTIVFRNNRTGKVETINRADIVSSIWRRVARGYELKLSLSDGRAYKYDGLRESEMEKIAAFLKSFYSIPLEQQEMSAKGWNWGECNFEGYELQFNVDSKRAFEIPLQNVSQCTPGKNEVALEFHQNDDAELSLMEVRFYIPPSQNDETDTVQDFSEKVISKADVLQAKGNAICIFQDLQCLTPRGRYDIRMYPKFVQLHGKTFDYKITYTSILRLFLLPHKDQRQIYFVVSLDPPVRQGQTRYHFLVLLFYKEDETSVELSLPEAEIEERFDNRLQKEMSGPMYEVVSRVIKNLVQRKITVPGTFKGPNGDQSIMCTYKASSGFLFPLERGFIYVHKPPVHIRFDEIAFVNFARGSTTNSRSFDFEVETRSQTTYVFSNIERNCYESLFDFVSKKKLKIKNTGKEGGGNYDMMGSDSEDEQHDAYLERMKQEAADRDHDDDAGNNEGSSEEDEDFNPANQPSEEVDEEYDSEVKNTSSEDNSADGADSEKESHEVKKKPKIDKPEKVKKVPKERGKKQKRKKKDPNAPKRPQSAYFLWLNENRSKIKEKHPGISITEITKVAGKMWKEVPASDKEIYNAQFEKSKLKYANAMKEYQSKGATVKIQRSPAAKTKSPAKQGTFKSKEFIQDSGSSSSDTDEPKSSNQNKSPSGSDEEAGSTPASSESE